MTEIKTEEEITKQRKKEIHSCNAHKGNIDNKTTWLVLVDFYTELQCVIMKSVSYHQDNDDD